ncbi:MAG: Uma2 family endonuclease [Hungatella sp.]|nr:Uma2 family endonuclease [Hungatella sp.]
MSEALAHANIYTEEDYYNLPEDVRAELVDGQIYYMSAPSRIHQEILGFMFNTIFNHINSSHDYIRKLNLYADAGVREYWIVNPIKETVFVYHLEETKFEAATYTFQDKIKVNIYDDLWIDFTELGL